MTESSTPIRLLLVDDHEMVRVGLAHLLSHYPELQVVGQAGRAAEAVEKARALRPDVVILDVRLPDALGYEAARQIRAEQPQVKILILSAFTDDELVFEAIAAGINGYLLKEINTDELVSAIQEISRGKSILSPAITDRVLSRLKASREDTPEKKILLLSKQEKRVLALVAEGKTNKEIGSDLELSEKTVKNYLSNLMDKLDFGRRTEAAAFYARHLAQKKD